MSIPDQEKLNKIERLKSKLYSRGYETKTGHHELFSHDSDTVAPSDWEHSDVVQKKTSNMQNSIFKKFFFFSFIFFALTVAYVGYMFFFGSNTISNENIDINVIGNTFVGSGEDLPLVIEIVNRNNSDLELVDLVVEYPKGAIGGLFVNDERQRSSLGTIASGSTRSENVKIVLFGEQATNRMVKISLEYRLAGSNSIFVKEKSHEVTINSTPINVLVDAPVEISPNQEMSLKIRVSSNADSVSPDTILKLDYPVGFEFISATPAPIYGNDLWNLSDMEPGKEREMVIVGRMIDVFDGEEKTFHVFTGLRDTKNRSELAVVLNSIVHGVSIKKPFIEARLSVNGTYRNEYVVNSKNLINGQIRWQNNLDTKVNDLAIVVKITGNVFDRKTISSPQGFYNSSEEYVVWDKNTIQAFSEVAPGETGVVTFSVAPTPLFSVATGLLSDPKIKIDVSISGKRALEGNILESLENFESKIVKISSDLGFSAKGLHYSGVFKNSGPMPPRADQETTYTIMWSITNTANHLSGARVQSTIPQWVRFLNVVSPASESLIYNPATREIVWNIGAIPRGTGITTTKKEVSFQIGFRPSLSQIGQTPALINSTILTTRDDFANVDLSGNRGLLNTSITGDPGFLSENAKVIE